MKENFFHYGFSTIGANPSGYWRPQTCDNLILSNISIQIIKHHHKLILERYLQFRQNVTLGQFIGQIHSRAARTPSSFDGVFEQSAALSVLIATAKHPLNSFELEPLGG